MIKPQRMYAVLMLGVFAWCACCGSPPPKRLGLVPMQSSYVPTTQQRTRTRWTESTTPSPPTKKEQTGGKETLAGLEIEYGQLQVEAIRFGQEVNNAITLLAQQRETPVRPKPQSTQDQVVQAADEATLAQSVADNASQQQQLITPTTFDMETVGTMPEGATEPAAKVWANESREHRGTRTGSDVSQRPPNQDVPGDPGAPPDQLRRSLRFPLLRGVALRLRRVVCWERRRPAFGLLLQQNGEQEKWR